MADYQTNRASFVTQEYRAKELKAQAVKDRNPDTARIVTIETNLDEASATAIGNKYLAANNQPFSYEIKLEGLWSLDDLIGGAPSFIPDIPDLATNGRTMLLMGFSVDDAANQTTIVVRG